MDLVEVPIHEPLVVEIWGKVSEGETLFDALSSPSAGLPSLPE